MHIDHYSFGSITIDGRQYRSDVIVFPDEVKDEWWREQGHLLSAADLKEVIDYQPEVLVIGKGSLGLMKVPAETKKLITNQGIQLITEKTSSACERFNQLHH